MQLDSLGDVLVDELATLYSAERQLVVELPRIAAAAHSVPLRAALSSHVETTRAHVQRLETCFADLGVRVPDETSEAMGQLLQEGAQILEARGEDAAIDVALIGAARRLAHFEIAGYRSARAIAGELELGATEALLERTLAEEREADRTLSQIAHEGLLGDAHGVAAQPRGRRR